VGSVFKVTRVCYRGVFLFWQWQLALGNYLMALPFWLFSSAIGSTHICLWLAIGYDLIQMVKTVSFVIASIRGRNQCSVSVSVSRAGVWLLCRVWIAKGVFSSIGYGLHGVWIEWVSCDVRPPLSVYVGRHLSVRGTTPIKLFLSPKLILRPVWLHRRMENHLKCGKSS
jgi:hypothetical protein